MNDVNLIEKERSQQQLIDQLILLRFKYEKVLNAAQSQFNVFSILRNERDEVGLHSRFLAELLDPNGCHQQRDLFLVKFLEIVGISGFTCESLCVAREDRKIDILISNSQKQAVIIENKIDAYDQDEQLTRYIAALKKTRIDEPWVIYLTLDGRLPSDSSLPESECKRLEESGRFFAISYALEIRDWLEVCIKECVSFPVLRETLVQYRELINRLTGNSLVTGYLMEIKNLILDKKENFIAAIDLEKGLIEAKTELQWMFWDELQKQLEKSNYKLSAKVNRDNIKDYYVKKRESTNFFVAVIIKEGIASVGIDGLLDLGIINDIEKSTDKRKLNNWIAANMHEELNDKFGADYDTSDNWPWFTSISKDLDFKNISGHTLKLLDVNARKEIVSNIVGQFAKIKSYAEDKLECYKI